ncbi:MAG: hypothetical protein AAF389_08610 [Gemmatimonadota bacterium]
MSGWVRRFRGIVGIGAVWGGFSGIVGGVLAVGAALLGAFPFAEAGEIMLGAAGLGFALGTGFATMLTAIEGRRKLEELSTGRAAVLGACVGAVAPIAVMASIFVPMMGAGVLLEPRFVSAIASGALSYGAITAALAAGTISIAKRGGELALPSAES